METTPFTSRNGTIYYGQSNSTAYYKHTFRHAGRHPSRREENRITLIYRDRFQEQELVIQGFHYKSYYWSSEVRSKHNLSGLVVEEVGRIDTGAISWRFPGTVNLYWCLSLNIYKGDYLTVFGNVWKCCVVYWRLILPQYPTNIFSRVYLTFRP